MKPIFYLLFFLVLSFSSCQKSESKPFKTIPVPGPKKESRNGFPVSGASMEAFVTDSDYEILDSEHGFLDNDTLKDAVIMVRKKDDNKSPRILLVLLQKKNQYKLAAKNETIMGAEFTKDNYKLNDSETLSIKSHQLNIEIFCQGPCGNTSLQFAWKEKDLVLTSLETYDQGAGGITTMEYNSNTKMARITEVNTMLEEMPEETENLKLDYKYSLDFNHFVVDSLTNAMYKNSKFSW